MTHESHKTSKAKEHLEHKKCPYCAEEIKIDAKKCKHCGELLDEAMREHRHKNAAVHQQKWNPGIAGLLSLLIPGAGQMYKGQIGNGLVWLLCVTLGYMFFIVPGLVLHLFCIAGAASGDPSK